MKLGEGEEEIEGEGAGRGWLMAGEGGRDWPSVSSRLREAAPAPTLPKRKIGSPGSSPPASPRRSAPLRSRRARISLERTDFPNRSPAASDERTGPPSRLFYGLDRLGRP